MDTERSNDNASSHEKPICVAVVVCNDVIEDVRTHNKTLVGLFSDVGVLGPTLHPRMFVMASLTNLIGTSVIRVTIKSPSGNTLFDNSSTMSGTDPLAVYDLVFEFVGLPLMEMGKYDIDVWWGTEHLVGRWFRVNPVSLDTSGG